MITRIHLLLLFTCLSFLSVAQEKKVMVFDIKSEIDPRMKRHVDLALTHADEIKADIIIVEMDSYGGALTDAKDIVDLIMAVKIPVWVFIDSDAASAGALISIACDSIYMSPGASIGAATVVTATGEKAPDKYQSYMRSIMRSTAEEHGRDPRIAEGMVDEDLVIEGIKKEGKIITFSTSEAIENGYCEAKVSSIDEILKRNGVESYTIEKFELSKTDSIIDFFMNPALSGILILIILGGIYFELQTPGVGFPILAAAIALVLYLVPYYLNGLAANWEVIALFLGLILIGVEIFVLPGFGIAGVAGITLTAGALVLIMVNNDFFDFQFVSSNNMLFAVTATLGGMLGGVILIFVAGSRLPGTKIFSRVALVDSQETTKGYTSSFFKGNFTGKKGVAYTVLRPSGRVMIDGELYDAFTRGDYIEKGQPIEVVGEDTTSLRVRLAKT